MSNLTVDFPELVDGLKPGGVVEVVRMERGSEKCSVGDNFLARQLIFIAAQSRHLAVNQSHVKV